MKKCFKRIRAFFKAIHLKMYYPECKFKTLYNSMAQKDKIDND